MGNIFGNAALKTIITIRITSMYEAPGTVLTVKIRNLSSITVLDGSNYGVCDGAETRTGQWQDWLKDGPMS